MTPQEQKEWTPADIKGLTSWVDVDTPLFNKWGWVIGLKDKSGHGNHWILKGNYSLLDIPRFWKIRCFLNYWFRGKR